MALSQTRWFHNAMLQSICFVFSKQACVAKKLQYSLPLHIVELMSPPEPKVVFETRAQTIGSPSYRLLALCPSPHVPCIFHWAEISIWSCPHSKLSETMLQWLDWQPRIVPGNCASRSWKESRTRCWRVGLCRKIRSHVILFDGVDVLILRP
jgi:hypothetical protein